MFVAAITLTEFLQRNEVLSELEALCARLADTIRQLRRRLEPYRRFSFQIGRPHRRIARPHGRIAKLVGDGNAQLAGALMREHMDTDELPRRRCSFHSDKQIVLC